jgi:hypothetical protein
MEQAAAPEEHAPTRRLSATARIGLAAVLATVVARILLGSFVVNDWEGWGTFVGFSLAVIVEGLVLGGLVFGVGVRLGSRGSEGRRVVAALVFGLLAVLSLAIPYSAPQPVIGAAAIALAVPTTRHGRARSASAGLLLGLVTITLWVAFMVFAVVTGDWPVNY